ncbi:TPA: hypothetical protein N0F65_000454 [Lagenidium giganteum]|uniref:Retrovirus-related Pol polyprotein from transposon TNT 1-94-like beta-barrel domain-containing protein n=1 Tax=Lagenidium giganteum TaxID=4803 RepID=A0AAV2YYP5_9STRA|nr:TPA: hypothetical protein N0F65_000454 [Lagenidium giganteum]
MLEDVVTIDDRCTMPDGSSLHVTHKGTATMTVVVDGTSRNITLSNACYSPKLAVNLISLCTIMEKGCRLEQRNGRHAITRAKNAS